MHSRHDIILQAGIVYLSFKTTVDDIEWSNSRRVDYVLCSVLTQWFHITGWQSLSIITTQVMILSSQTVGGLILNFVFPTCIQMLSYCRVSYSCLPFKSIMDDIEWSDSRRVEGINYQSKWPRFPIMWRILDAFLFPINKSS